MDKKFRARRGFALHNSRTMKQIATITVIGEDKTGVVARVTGVLFEQGANIEGPGRTGDAQGFPSTDHPGVVES